MEQGRRPTIMNCRRLTMRNDSAIHLHSRQCENQVVYRCSQTTNRMDARRTWHVQTLFTVCHDFLLALRKLLTREAPSVSEIAENAVSTFWLKEICGDPPN